jgi:hypothetical protein
MLSLGEAGQKRDGINIQLLLWCENSEYKAIKFQVETAEAV